MDIRIVVTAVMRRAMLFRTLEVRTANRKPRSDVNYADAALSYASPCCLLLELLATIAGSIVAPAPSPSALCSACFTNAPHRQVRGGQPCTMFPPAAFPCLGISGMITPDSPPQTAVTTPQEAGTPTADQAADSYRSREPLRALLRRRRRRFKVAYMPERNSHRGPRLGLRTLPCGL